MLKRCPCQDDFIGMSTLHIGLVFSEKTGLQAKGFSFTVMGDGGIAVYDIIALFIMTIGGGYLLLVRIIRSSFDDLV